jgi:hypothetical protein
MSTTISANLLESRPAAFKQLFSAQPIYDTPFFDEGPRPHNNRPTTSMSGAMDTTAADPYTQGVEITRQKQYDAGLAKIWSGEPGHRLATNRYGMDKNFFPNPGFADLDLFDPLTYLRAQEQESPLWVNILTFPIITGDNDQLENFNFNGIIEPLTIRPVAAFFSIEAPFESHAVRGSLVGGNLNQINASDRILSVDYFEPEQEIIGYLDMVDMIEGHPLNGYFRFEFTPLLPFSDDRLVRNVKQESYEPSDMAAAMSLMTGSTDNYVRHNQRSATCGWYYDNNASIGTDSLAFGGMTY